MRLGIAGRPGECMSSLQIKELSFSYEPGKKVIDNLSVAINKGEMWSIIGKNGSGKSTLIRCIARLEPVKRGTITIDHQEILDFSSIEMARRCSYVPQATLRIPPHFTVLEYVLMGRYPYCGLEKWTGKLPPKLWNLPIPHRSVIDP